MLDIKFIRENPDLVKKAVKDKQLAKTVDIDLILELDKKYLEVLRVVEDLRAKKNRISEQVQNATGVERDELIKQATKVKQELAEHELEIKVVQENLDKLLLWVPNVPAPDVPYGEGENDNVEVKKWGEIREFDFEPLDHLDLGLKLDIIDVERGAKIAGFRGYFLKNEGVILEQAILKFAQDFMVEQGFTLMSVPWMVKPEYFTGTGYFPWGEDDHYSTQDGQALIGTAEVSLTSYYANEILEFDELPVKLVGISPCFRREVGSYGKDTKGIFRVHQFTKVEQVVLVPEGEEISREWHDKMLNYSEQILQKLELPYHVLLMCTGDMGGGQRKKYDIETWFPSQGVYRETHSDSYFLDFQSRRLNMRYRDENGELKFVSTLNNTVAATPRLMAAVLENYQTKDGSVEIPEVLHKYTNGLKVIEPK